MEFMSSSIDRSQGAMLLHRDLNALASLQDMEFFKSGKKNYNGVKEKDLPGASEVVL